MKVKRADPTTRRDLVVSAAACARGRPSPRAETAILASSPDSFWAFFRIVAASTAEPAWFSTPVDATEDDESYTVTFDVANVGLEDLVVEGRDRPLLIWRSRGAAPDRQVRTCMLAEPIEPGSVAIARSGACLRVCVRKKGCRLVASGAGTPAGG